MNERLAITRRPSQEEAAALFHFDPRELSRLWRIFNRNNKPQITTVGMLQLALIDWSRHAARLDATDAERAILAWSDSRLEQYTNTFELSEIIDNPQPIGIHFLVLDRRFVAIKGSPTILDLKENKFVSDTPYVPMTTVMCDLDVLLRHLLGKLERLRTKESKDGRQQDGTGSIDRSGPTDGSGTADST
jgi:hypothetical protein